MIIRGKKKIDDFLSIMSDKPPSAAKIKDVPSAEHPDFWYLKSETSRLLRFLTKARWRCADDVRRAFKDKPEESAAPLISVPVGEDHRLMILLLRWATDEIDGEVEITWIGRSNVPNSNPKSPVGHSAK